LDSCLRRNDVGREEAEAVLWGTPTFSPVLLSVYRKEAKDSSYPKIVIYLNGE
jgi:hypothetical protein